MIPYRQMHLRGIFLINEIENMRQKKNAQTHESSGGEKGPGVYIIFINLDLRHVLYRTKNNN